MDIDKGDFFFGTDFCAIGSCGKRRSEGLGNERWTILVALDGLLALSGDGFTGALGDGFEDFRWPEPCFGGAIYSLEGLKCR